MALRISATSRSLEALAIETLTPLSRERYMARQRGHLGTRISVAPGTAHSARLKPRRQGNRGRRPLSPASGAFRQQKEAFIEAPVSP